PAGIWLRLHHCSPGGRLYLTPHKRWTRSQLVTSGPRSTCAGPESLLMHPPQGVASVVNLSGAADLDVRDFNLEARLEVDVELDNDPPAIADQATVFTVDLPDGAGVAGEIVAVAAAGACDGDEATGFDGDVENLIVVPSYA